MSGPTAEEVKARLQMWMRSDGEVSLARDALAVIEALEKLAEQYHTGEEINGAFASDRIERIHQKDAEIASLRARIAELEQAHELAISKHTKDHQTIEGLRARADDLDRKFMQAVHEKTAYIDEVQRLRARLSRIEGAAPKNDRITLRVIARRLEVVNADSANIADGQFLRRLADALDLALTEEEPTK
jgi:DNA repair exonuclease SbcCD ATPase subunit